MQLLVLAPTKFFLYHPLFEQGYEQAHYFHYYRKKT